MDLYKQKGGLYSKLNISSKQLTTEKLTKRTLLHFTSMITSFYKMFVIQQTLRNVV